MMARILGSFLNVFIVHQIFSVNCPVDGHQIDTSDMIHKICSEERLMLRSGLPRPIASKMIKDKIVKLATIEPKSSQKGIQLERNTQVGEYGQSIKSNVLGVEQAIMSNFGVTIDETNNYVDESEINLLKFNSRLSVPLGKRMYMSSSDAAQLDESNNYADKSEINRLKSHKNPLVPLEKRVNSSNMVQRTSIVPSECEKKVLKLIEEAILSRNSSHYMSNDLRKGHDPKMGEGSFGGGMIDSRASSLDYPTITSVADETSISPYGYNFDLAQTASGDCQNSFSGTSDQHSHSTYSRSKVSQITLSISPGVNI